MRGWLQKRGVALLALAATLVAAAAQGAEASDSAGADGAEQKTSSTDAGAAEEDGTAEQEGASEEESPEALREFDRTGHLPVAKTAKERRVCHLCPRRGFSMTLSVPLWLPWTSLNSSGQEDLPGGGQDPPQVIEGNSSLQFAFVGELGFRIGAVDIEAMAVGGGLGTRPVLSVDDLAIQLGEMDLAGFMARGSVRWRIPPLRMAKGPRAVLLGLWPHLGVRYYGFYGRLSDNNGAVIWEPDLHWIDPLLGWTAIADFHNGLAFKIGGDVGGFTIGSDVSVFAQTRLEYNVFGWMGVYAGWMLMYSSAKPDTPVVRLLVDRIETLTHGPSVGLSFTPF